MDSDIDVAAELERVAKELEEEIQFWITAKLPPAAKIWRLGENEFMHHVHVFALDKLMRDILGNDIVELKIKETFLEEMRLARKEAKQARRDAMRDSITDNIGIIRPKPEI